MQISPLRFVVRTILVLAVLLLVFMAVKAFNVDFPAKKAIDLAGVISSAPINRSEGDDYKKPEKIGDDTILPVPYVSEAPEGIWSGNWVNACEEATIAMVEFFYKGDKSVSVPIAKSLLLKLFDEQDEIYGSNKNANAKQIQEIITNHSSFNAIIKSNPTIEDIKREIDDGRPVISLHRGFDLQNQNIPFSPIKSSYHTVVIVGYNDTKKEFITHDPGDEFDGVNHRYDYYTFMNSIHDYVPSTDKANGTPTVIFTRKK